ncbi:TIGR02270 family protein [Yoonia sp.]|uniref:TIGR02270 family protein n=1 Tax=Yoonia sp. TaxID=2212373 RepID=UPI0023929852|nr:TIGR02270 family protein [Yoonia sp.]MDE0851230.1 TIGR02270 family protein [Yoonia sp.]
MKHIPIILTQHVEDAAVLWERRRRAVNAPHYNAMYLSRLDEQLEAHVDGLRIAGSAGWDQAVAAFEDIQGGGEAFILSTLAFGHQDASLIPPLIELIQTDPKNFLSPAASGIGWLHRSALQGKVDPLLNSADPVARGLGIGACAVHRVDLGARLAPFLDDVTGVKRRAVRLAGELGRADLLPQIQMLCDDADGETAYWAAWSAVLLGDRGTALQRLLTTALSGGPKAEHALRTALPAMGFDAGCKWLNGQPTTAETIAIKIIGYGILGDAGAVPWLITQMADTGLAQIAGESYAMITGADLEEDDLVGDKPSDVPEMPNDDPTDHNVSLEDNENLAWATPELVAAHWQKVRSKFGQGAWFLGRSASLGAYQFGVTAGYQRQRRLGAFWAAHAAPTAQLPNWHLPSFPKWPT